ncbi:MAG: CbiQ family ECF transporter T component [Bacteroidota bacterium]
MTLSERYNYDHRLAGHPLFVKILYVVPVLLLLVFSNSELFSGCVFAGYFLLTRWFAKVSFRAIFSLYSIPLFFILTGCVTIAISANASNPLIDVPWLSPGFEKEGLFLAGKIFLKSMGIVSVVFFGLLTFSVSDMAEMMNDVKLPAIFVDIFVLTYKFIFFIFMAADSSLIAQKSRLAYGAGQNKIYHFSLLVTSVFTKAFRKTRALEISANSRLCGDQFTFLREKRSIDKGKLIPPLMLTIFWGILFFLVR